jgi:hypothetical protein
LSVINPNGGDLNHWLEVLAEVAACRGSAEESTHVPQGMLNNSRQPNYESVSLASLIHKDVLIFIVTEILTLLLSFSKYLFLSIK